AAQAMHGQLKCADPTGLSDVTHNFLPPLVQPAELQSKLGSPNLLLVDLSHKEVYDRGHLPGAIFLDYDRLLAANPPAMGLLPSAEHLSQVMSEIGLTPQTHVVAYDGEGNSRAARFLWTLDV